MTARTFPFNASPARIGAWQSNFSAEAIVLSRTQRQTLERVLNQQYVPAARQLFGSLYKPQNYMLARHGVPAVTVRFDMPPMDGERFAGLYEVEANTAGFGIASAAGVPLAGHIAASLKALGLASLGVGVAPARAVQLEDLMVLARGLQARGIAIVPVDVVNGVPRNLPLWLRAGQEDFGVMGHLVPQCLNLHNHGGGHKGYLLALDPTARTLDRMSPREACSLLDAYETGLTLKPVSEWGTHAVGCYARQKPWKDRGVSRSRMERELLGIVNQGRGQHYITQQFRPPEFVAGGFRIWRVIAVWYPDFGYRVIGGLWNWRPGSLRVHGASDAVFGPIAVHV